MKYNNWLKAVREKYTKGFVLDNYKKYSDKNIRFISKDYTSNYVEIQVNKDICYILVRLYEMSTHGTWAKPINNFEEGIKIIQEIIGEFEFYERKLIKSKDVFPIIDYQI